MREFVPDRKLLERAEALTEIDRWEEAIPLLTRYLVQEPDSFRANCFLSACFYHLKKSPDALKYAETSILHNPLDEWGHRLRSLALTQANRHQEALLSAKEAVRLAPEEPLAVQRLMNAYLNCKMTREALQEGEKLLSLQPEKEDAYVTVGYILMEKRRYRQAEDLFYKALKINPASATALNNLGVIYLRQQNEDKAFEFFQRAIQADPNDKLAQDNLKITVKNTPSWQHILIYALLGIVFPPILLGLLISFLVDYRKKRRFSELPESVQLFLKSGSRTRSFEEFWNDFLDSKITLRATKILFFMALILLVNFLLIALITFTKHPEDIPLTLSVLFITTIIVFALGFFWNYLAKRAKSLY